jgi:acetate---CoA ligase (ADP-forming)
MFEQEALRSLLRPRSLAFVGVSTRGGSGVKMLQSTRTFGFDGPVWPVHPNASEIAGRACFPSISVLPSSPDCVVVSVPASSVLQVLEEAAQKGVRAALVVSEGFADAANEEGRARQEQLAAFAKEAGMAIAGPNCMGVASLAYRSAATMADIPDTVVAGGVSLVSQSGGLLNAVAELCANRGIGLNFLVSIGNQAVVDLADYIDFLLADPATSVIAIIMEGAKDGARFRQAIERAAGRKPVVVLKLGRSAFGQAATLAHTGTLAGRHEAFAALFKQTGTALVDSIDELVETSALFAVAPPPKGDGVCMFTVSGGATSLIGDLGEKAGVNFPPLSPAANQALERILDVERQFGNPLDTVGMPRLLKDGAIDPLVDALLADESIDVIGLVLGMRLHGAASHEDLIDRLAKKTKTASKPLLAVSFMSDSLTAKWRGFARERGLPLLEDLECGMRAIRHLIDFAGRQRKNEQAEIDGAACIYSVPPPGAILTEAESKTILGAAGLPVTKEFLAATPEEAARVAAMIGGPVALKIQSPDIPHKSDVGGVHLGARGAQEVEAAAAKVLANGRKARPDAKIDGVLVQEMVEGGVEFILGMTLDDQLGPLIVLGAGGVSVEVFKDVASRLAPLVRADVLDMIAGLRSRVLLEGFRGAPPCDVEALVDCCLRFSDFVVATRGRIAAIDLNPVFVRHRGQGVRIADALIVAAPS